jgi:hypothetical protein
VHPGLPPVFDTIADQRDVALLDDDIPEVGVGDRSRRGWSDLPPTPNPIPKIAAASTIRLVTVFIGGNCSWTATGSPRIRQTLTLPNPPCKKILLLCLFRPF